MKIVLIGAGRLAFHLAKALRNAGHDIVQVYSRTMASASQVAEIAGASPTTDLQTVVADADVYILAVTDSALAEVVPVVCKGREQKVFLHTAGSMPLEVFRGMAMHYGVFYPMQTFSKERDVDFSQIPCFVEGNDELAVATVSQLAFSLTARVYRLSSDRRKYLHLAAVFACNFTNHCYAIAADLLEQHGIPFDVMLPLIDETARKVHELTPLLAQTGPAVRYDENVIRAQSQLLRDNPFVKEIYDRMSMNIYRKSHANDTL